MRKTIPLAAALFSLISLPALADWQEDVNQYDQARLLRLEDSKADGLRQADRAAPAKHLDAIHGVLDLEGRPISGGEMLGTWQCRQMKLGGWVPSVVYDWFTCRVRETKAGLYFEKLTGSEFISGYIEDYRDGRLVLMGAISERKNHPKPYSGANLGAGAKTTSSDAIGMISSIGRDHVKIEFPYPTIESDFDVMELRR